MIGWLTAAVMVSPSAELASKAAVKEASDSHVEVMTIETRPKTKQIANIVTYRDRSMVCAVMATMSEQKNMTAHGMTITSVSNVGTSRPGAALSTCMKMKAHVAIPANVTAMMTGRCRFKLSVMSRFLPISCKSVNSNTL